MQPIAIESLRSSHPSLFASKPAEHVSKDYKFVSTERAIEILAEANWHPVQIKAPKFRTQDRLETGRHCVVFRNFDIEPSREVGHVFPSIRLLNSHDWSSRFELLGGLFRMVCSNGLFVAAQASQISIRHDRVFEDISTFVGGMVEFTGRVMDRVNTWDGYYLNDEQTMRFAQRAAALRFGDAADASVAQQIAMPLRSDDQANTLWNVFNRAQEHLMRGGFRAPNMTRMGRTRRARAIGNLEVERRLNESLWSLAEEFAPA